MQEITGHTRVFAILGDPITQVKTPQVVNPRLEALGFAGVVIPCHVAPEDLAATVASFRRWKNFGGCIITVPHKTAMAALCDTVAPHAQAIGAVNCVRRDPDGTLHATMLDGLGYVAGMRKHGIEPRGKSVYLAGAGGAANAIAFAFAEAGVARLTIANRTRAKSDDLAARLARLHPGLAVSTAPTPVSEHDIVVNATSLGMKEGDPHPLNFDEIAPHQIVGDAIMQPEKTALLLAAEAKGCRIHLGRPMLEAQIELFLAHLGVTT